MPRKLKCIRHGIHSSIIRVADPFSGPQREPAPTTLGVPPKASTQPHIQTSSIKFGSIDLYGVSKPHRPYRCRATNRLPSVRTRKPHSTLSRTPALPGAWCPWTSAGYAALSFLGLHALPPCSRNASGKIDHPGRFLTPRPNLT